MKRILFEIILGCIIAILICVCVILGFNIQTVKLQNKLDVKLDYSKYNKELENEQKIFKKYEKANLLIENKEKEDLEKLLRYNIKGFKKNFFGKKNMPIYIRHYPKLKINFDNTDDLNNQLRYRLYIELLNNQIRYRANYILQKE